MRSTPLTGATPCHASMARERRRFEHLEMFPEVTLVFIALSNAQEEVKVEWMTILEHSNQAQPSTLGLGF